MDLQEKLYLDAQDEFLDMFTEAFKKQIGHDPSDEDIASALCQYATQMRRFEQAMDDMFLKGSRDVQPVGLLTDTRLTRKMVSRWQSS